MTTARTATTRPIGMFTPDGFEAADALVWWWKVSADADMADDLTLLSDSERVRARRFRSADKAAEFVICRAAMRRILSGFLQISADELVLGRRPRAEYEDADHGPPAIIHPNTPLHISLSHAKGLGMLALSPFHVGIDVELNGRTIARELTDAALTSRERTFVLSQPDEPGRSRAFLLCWTRKEAALKAVGTGITSGLGALESHAWKPGPARMTAPWPGAPATWWVGDAEAPDGWTASIALAGEPAGPVAEGANSTSTGDISGRLRRNVIARPFISRRAS
ncbi:4'-phosphopantetheinyl transferase family protein [Streptomyces sp. NPDC017546]|uniref:4'-phosphopantetheinyl transferase family protein n=1 Tax=Streptomyces sp. NPDC017546 TaxID=3365001 RepID=UPI00378D2281